MSIEKSEFEDLAASFFAAVKDGIADESVVAEHFVYPEVRLIAPDGTHFDIAAHRQMHQRFRDEQHALGDFELVQICDSPERARAKGWVHFEASYRDKPEVGRLKSIVGEEYILERGEDGKVRFLQYNSTFFATLPDSAPFDIS